MAMIPMELASAGLDGNGILWPIDEVARISDRFQDWQRKKPNHRFPVRAGMAPDGPIVGVVNDMSWHPNTDSLQVTVDTSVATKVTCNDCGHETFVPGARKCSNCGGDDVVSESYVDQANNLLNAGRLVCFIEYDEEHLQEHQEYRGIKLVRIGVVVPTG
jgi:hypothetical protein